MRMRMHAFRLQTRLMVHSSCWRVVESTLITQNWSTYTVKTAVLLCELNRHIRHSLRVLLQVHELMQRVLSKMCAQCGLIQHVLTALSMVHTSKCVFFCNHVHDSTPDVCTINAQKSNQHYSSWSTCQTFLKTTHEKLLTSILVVFIPIWRINIALSRCAQLLVWQ